MFSGSRDDLALLLRRAGFGGTPAEVDGLVGLDLATVVDRVLDMSTAPPVVVPGELSNPTLTTFQQWVAMHTWWIDRMTTTPAPLQEKMTLFWHGHFASALDKVGIASVMFGQNQLFRTMGLASFRALSQAVAVDPAMLVYLDNYRNVAGAQNENFAREYMELFSLGTNQYTQDDVVAAARAWTGHGVDATRTQYVFTPSRHDNGTKTFMGVTRNWNGPEIIDAICNGPTKPVVARFLAKELWSFFAYPDPSDSIVNDLGAVLAASNDLDISSVVRAIFLRPEFFSPQTTTGLVRTPTEFVVAALRSTGLSAAVTHPESYTAAMGQQLFYPPNVAGWPQNGYWINSGAAGAKINFARTVSSRAAAGGLLSGVPKAGISDAVTQALQTFGVAASPPTRVLLETWLAADRAAGAVADQQNLMTLTMLTPDFQLA